MGQNEGTNEVVMSIQDVACLSAIHSARSSASRLSVTLTEGDCGSRACCFPLPREGFRASRGLIGAILRVYRSHTAYSSENENGFISGDPERFEAVFRQGSAVLVARRRRRYGWMGLKEIVMVSKRGWAFSGCLGRCADQRHCRAVLYVSAY
jgi:hypothetical protein